MGEIADEMRDREYDRAFEHQSHSVARVEGCWLCLASHPDPGVRAIERMSRPGVTVRRGKVERFR